MGRPFLGNGFLPSAASSGGGVGFYGTGVDGDLTVSGTRTETQHRAYDTVIVPASQIWQPNGFLMAARRRIVIAGTVRRNGTTATSNISGTTITANSFWSTAHGAASGGTAAGSAAGGSTNQPAFGGTGGN